MKIEIILTGTKYYRGFPALDIGGEVRIEFDEENTYSENAFSVSTVGGLRIGSVAENPRYIPRVMTSEATKLSPELKELINNGYTIVKAVCTKIRNNLGVIEVTLNNPLPIEEMEELPMDKKEMSVVGISHHAGKVSEGDLVSFKIYRGNSTLYNVKGESCGVLPQGESKIAELEAIDAPIVKNRDAKAANTIYDKPYIVYGVIEDKYIFVRPMNEEDLINTTNNDPEEVVLDEKPVKEVKPMFDIIAIGFTKMEELKTLYDVENIVEEVVEEIEPVNETTDILNELDELNSSIRALNAQKEAIEAEMAELMAKREELAAINAKRNALIKEIQESIETLDLSVLEAMKELMSSSDVEEDTSSSIEEETVPEVVQKVHEGKELSFDEWKEYVEFYWKHGFDILRKEEEELGFNDFKAIERFVNKIKRFNKQLKEFKSEGYDEILTLYWIKNMELLKVVCNAYELTSHRLTRSCIMDDNDLSFFLEG